METQIAWTEKRANKKKSPTNWIYSLTSFYFVRRNGVHINIAFIGASLILVHFFRECSRARLWWWWEHGQKSQSIFKWHRENMAVGTITFNMYKSYTVFLDLNACTHISSYLLVNSIFFFETILLILCVSPSSIPYVITFIISEMSTCPTANHV